MSHRSKLYGMYEEEGGFEAIMGMSKADEMLEKAGYKKIIDDKYRLVYRNYKRILDDNFDFRIDFAKIPKFVFSEDERGGTVGIDMETLQAINEKCKELGWL